jgi:putative membrane protein
MWNGPYGMMGGWDGWGWFWPFHFIIPLLFFALIIAVVVLLVRYATGWGDHPQRPERRPPGLDVLEERYARGEINRDEFLEKKRDITG